MMRLLKAFELEFYGYHCILKWLGNKKASPIEILYGLICQEVYILKGDVRWPVILDLPSVLFLHLEMGLEFHWNLLI